MNKEETVLLELEEYNARLGIQCSIEGYADGSNQFVPVNVEINQITWYKGYLDKCTFGEVLKALEWELGIES